MSTVLRIAAVASACMLAACASQTARTAQAPPSTARIAYESQPPRIVTDGDYVARVEREARRRGLGIQWINPPVRRTRD